MSTPMCSLLATPLDIGGGIERRWRQYSRWWSTVLTRVDPATFSSAASSVYRARQPERLSAMVIPSIRPSVRLSVCLPLPLSIRHSGLLVEPNCRQFFSSSDRRKNFLLKAAVYRVGQKVGCWFQANYVNKLRRYVYEECGQMRASTERMEHRLIFSGEIFYVAIVLCLNILWLKAVNEITSRQTRTSFVNTTS